MSSEGKRTNAERQRIAHALISKFISLFKEHHGYTVTVNRYSLKWGMLDVIDSVGPDRAYELLEYYFHTGTTHSLDHFYKTFDKLDINLSSISEDRIRRAKIRENTKRLVEGDSN
jgi:hypothetical protein